MAHDMTRRDFFKALGAAVAAAPLGALACGSAPLALAAGGTTCTCDVYVPYSVHKMILAGGDAYLTNPTVPSLGNLKFPTSSNPDNATYVANDDGTVSVTVPIVNTGFMLVSIEGTSTDGTATISDIKYTDTDVSDCPQRISQFTVTLPALSTSASYVFDATEYANTFILTGPESWQISVKAYA